MLANGLDQRLVAGQRPHGVGQQQALDLDADAGRGGRGLFDDAADVGLDLDVYKRQREPYPGVLVLSPWNGQVAKREGQADVPEGMSVMQTLAGEVVDVVKNDTVGVLSLIHI